MNSTPPIAFLITSLVLGGVSASMGSVALAFGMGLHGVALDAVAQRAAGPFAAHQAEARLFLRAVDDERQHHRLGAVRGVEGAQPDVVIREGLAAALELQ